MAYTEDKQEICDLLLKALQAGTAMIRDIMRHIE